MMYSAGSDDTGADVEYGELMILSDEGTFPFDSPVPLTSDVASRRRFVAGSGSSVETRFGCREYVLRGVLTLKLAREIRQQEIRRVQTSYDASVQQETCQHLSLPY
jgi:hypothetical protein